MAGPANGNGGAHPATAAGHHLTAGGDRAVRQGGALDQALAHAAVTIL